MLLLHMTIYFIYGNVKYVHMYTVRQNCTGVLFVVQYFDMIKLNLLFYFKPNKFICQMFCKRVFVHCFLTINDTCFDILHVVLDIFSVSKFFLDLLHLLKTQ